MRDFYTADADFSVRFVPVALHKINKFLTLISGRAISAISGFFRDLECLKAVPLINRLRFVRSTTLNVNWHEEDELQNLGLITCRL